MNRFIVYTRLRLKAVLKIFPSMCVMTFLLCLSLGGMLYLQSARSIQVAEGDEDATVSIGISDYNGQTDKTVEEILTRADKAMYEARNLKTNNQ